MGADRQLRWIQATFALVLISALFSLIASGRCEAVLASHAERRWVDVHEIDSKGADG